MRNSKRVDIMDDMNFAQELWGMTRNTVNSDSVKRIQSAIRLVIDRYGFNPGMYPRATRHFFWSVISGDTWGSYRRAVKRKRKSGEPLDATDETVVHYSC